MQISPRNALRLAILALALAASVAPARSRAATVWTAIATEKLYPATAARTDRTASISAARNEFEAFQIGVTGTATNVSATATALSGPGGATLPAPRLYREGLINITQASSADGRLGWQPDVLIPDVDEVVGEKRNAFPFTVPAGETRGLWVDVFVPDSATPGRYTGTVTVTMAEGRFDVPVTLTVRAFKLPSTASLKSAFILGYVGLPAGHGVTGGSTEMAVLRQRYGAFALDHRITLPRHDDGTAGLDHFAQYYGPLVNGTAATRLPGARLTSVQYQGGDGDYSSWTTFFKARGWFDRLFQYTCDEPPITCSWSDIPVRAAKAKAADPNFRTLVTTTITEANDNGVASSIDLMVPVVNWMDDRAGFTYAGEQRSKYDSFLAAQPRRELWMYESCMSHGCGGTVAIGDASASAQYYTGWPTYMIDASAVRNRAMQWFEFRYGATGELYFETTMAYQHDPWNNQWDFSGNGDGTLFYPGTPEKIGGTTHIPLASIRLKMIREGMEDYEYLKMLSDLGSAALANQVAAGLFPHPYSAEQSPASLMAARARIGDAIEQIVAPVVAGTSPADPAPGDAAPAPVPGDGSAASPTPAAPADPSSTVPPVLADGSLPSSTNVAAAMNAGGCSAPGTTGLAALLGLLAALRRRARKR